MRTRKKSFVRIRRRVPYTILRYSRRRCVRLFSGSYCWRTVVIRDYWHSMQTVWYRSRRARTIHWRRIRSGLIVHCRASEWSLKTSMPESKRSKSWAWNIATGERGICWEWISSVASSIRNFDCDISSNLILHGCHKRNCVERPYQRDECSRIAGKPPKLRHGYGSYRQA